MKALNELENCGKSRQYAYKITHIYDDNCPRVLKLDIKVMLRLSSLTLWADMKTNLSKYSLIFIKLLEINEILPKRSSGYTCKITYISVDSCPKVPNLISQQC